MTNKTKSYLAESFDFTAATPVIADAKKPRFLLPVGAIEFGALEGNLVYPASHEKAGQSVADEYNPAITDKKGLVFLNKEENNYVRLPADGTGYIIMNGVNEETGKLLAAKVKSYNSNPEKLTADQYLEVVSYAHSLGVNATYNTNDAYVLGEPAKAKAAAFVGSKEGFDATGERPFGLYTRSRDTLKAVFLAGAVKITSQHVVNGQFPNGAALVETTNGITPIQPSTFEDTYLNPDGTKLKAANMAPAKLKLAS